MDELGTCPLCQGHGYTVYSEEAKKVSCACIYGMVREAIVRIRDKRAEKEGVVKDTKGIA